ncbi:MAG TPA: hypothetical protein VNN80_01260 [Polyangiaceae bacterium]|nr:hypothetical protein [Polyangiaceae bacterium]
MASERDETVGIEHDALALEEGALQRRVIGIVDADLAAPGVSLAEHALPGQRLGTGAHGPSGDPVTRRDAGERRYFSICCDGAARDGAHHRIDASGGFAAGFQNTTPARRRTRGPSFHVRTMTDAEP